MTPRRTVTVLGASGFVGSAAMAALSAAGQRTVALTTPRLPPTSVHDVDLAVSAADAVVEELAARLEGSDVVVCCAGLARATSGTTEALVAANGVLPGVIGRAAGLAGVTRFLHVSSAAVQGAATVLDASDLVQPFSPYATSKVLGERSAARYGPSHTTIYRPPSVHGPGRVESKQLVRIARSPLASVASPGDDRTAVAHIDNVAAAIAFLTLTSTPPPAVVSHPWEGLTTTSLLELLGGRPLRVPRRLARAGVRALTAAGRVRPGLAGHARRLEVLWFGQSQARSWLEEAGFVVDTDPERWRALGVGGPETVT